MRSFLFGMLGGAAVCAIAAITSALVTGWFGDTLTVDAAEDAYRARGYEVTTARAAVDWFKETTFKPRTQRLVASAYARPSAFVYEFGSRDEATEARKKTDTGGIAAPTLYQNENLLLYVVVGTPQLGDQQQYIDRLVGIFYGLR